MLLTTRSRSPFNMKTKIFSYYIAYVDISLTNLTSTHNIFLHQCLKANDAAAALRVVETVA